MSEQFDLFAPKHQPPLTIPAAMAAQQLLKLCPVLCLYWSDTRLDCMEAGQEDESRTFVCKGGDTRCQLEVKGQRCGYHIGHSCKCHPNPPEPR